MKVPVNEPIVSDLAKRYVNDALESGWISSAGKYVDQFENSFAKYLDVEYATTTSNGTTALHLAMLALGIGKGDEVIIPDLTIASCAFAAMYVGATPVFCDVERSTGNIDITLIEKLITPRTKAVIVVHLYGHPADMDPIMEIATRHNLAIIEDAAEAHGAEYKGSKVGSIGTIGCFSFYANKIVTTGEGGMLVTNDQTLYERARLLKDLAHRPGERFTHDYVGYNFRLTNLQSALGLAHLEEIDLFLSTKWKMAEMYNELLAEVPQLLLPIEHNYAKSVYWMYNVVLDTTKTSLSRADFMSLLKERGIDTRTYFSPLHRQPAIAYRGADEFPVSDSLSQNGLYLPSGLAITEEQMVFTATVIKDIFSEKSK